MLRYFDPLGREIDAREWRRLYARGGAGRPQRFSEGGFEAELSWVGVASSLERGAPGLWLVRACSTTSPGP